MLPTTLDVIFPWRLLPGHNYDEVHDIPDVAQISSRVEDEAEGNHFKQRLDAKNT